MMYYLVAICAILCGLIGQSEPRHHPSADIRNYPYVAAMLDSDLDEFLGLAVIVSKNLLFTEEVTVPVEELRFRVGSSQWTSGGKIVRAKELIDYHYYNLVVLDEDLEFCDNVQPIVFANNSKSMDTSMPMEIVGWGHLSEIKKSISSELLSVRSELVKHSACQMAYEDIFEEVPDEIPLFCLDYAPSHGVFDEAESLAIANGVLYGLGIYRDENQPQLFVHASMFSKKVRQTIRKYSE